MLLALLAERASGLGFHDLVRSLVWEPAGMADTAFLRSDELPGARRPGYLTVDGLRTNVLHLPVLGNGDGGVVLDRNRPSGFWEALFAGRIVRRSGCRDGAPAQRLAGGAKRYGLGFHLARDGRQRLARGVRRRRVVRAARTGPRPATTCTVISNWTDGAWPVVSVLDEWLAD